MEATPKIIVLMYHRVDNRDTDPWGICVTPKHFEEQVRCIKELVPVISAPEAVQKIKSGALTETCICITFDDGYSDNVVNALPILAQHHCPATFFIATAFTDSSFPYWWDELEMICLHSARLPAVLLLSVNGKEYKFEMETELAPETWQRHIRWKWYEEAPTRRCAAFLSLWNLLRPLHLACILQKMEELRAWSGTNFRSRLPAGKEQLQRLCQHKIATIGLHTHTHPDLPAHSSQTQAEDIQMGKSLLKKEYGTEANLLAYPYGRYDAETVSVAKRLGIEGGFTTEAAPVLAHSHPSQIGRYQVMDCNGQDFSRQLAGWLSA